MNPAFVQTDALSRIFNVLAHESNSPQEDVPIYPDTLFWLWADQCLLLLLYGEASNTNFNVFDFTRPGIEPTTFREHANHYTTEANL